METGQCHNHSMLRPVLAPPLPLCKRWSLQLLEEGSLSFSVVTVLASLSRGGLDAESIQYLPGDLPVVCHGPSKAEVGEQSGGSLQSPVLLCFPCIFYY